VIHKRERAESTWLELGQSTLKLLVTAGALGIVEARISPPAEHAEKRMLRK
jgi:hypothetical protein